MLTLIFSLTAPASTPLIGTTYTVSAAVKLSNSKLVLIKGQKKQLKISGTSKKAKWYTSKKTVATVSSKGVVTAVKNGSVTITAKIGSKKYRCKVTVETPSLSAQSKTIYQGKSAQLSVKGTTQPVSWKSSNKAVASVSKKGVVTAKKAGKCTITATVLGKKYKCTITVKANSASSSTSTYVWLSASGTKYHKIPNCGTMNPAKAKKVSRHTLSSRYSACSKCFR